MYELYCLKSNSFLTMASNPYLTGDMYWNQLIHAWMSPELANYPPNKIRGIIIIPASDTAISSLSKMLEMK
jgi:hypothetical protein